MKGFPSRLCAFALMISLAVSALRQPDFYVALIEDLIAIGGSLFIVSRF